MEQLDMVPPVVSVCTTSKNIIVGNRPFSVEN